MSHTLHREGSVESLKRDFVVLCMSAQGLNVEGSGPKFKRYFEIARKFHPVNIGENKNTGSLAAFDYDTIVEKTTDGCVCLAVFDDEKNLIGFLRALKEEDLGLSVVVSGLMDQVKACCSAADLKVHTVNLSLGVLGRTEKLPGEKVREITTMCGHGMITGDLVLYHVDRIRRGLETAAEASKAVCRLCICGAFNPARSAILFQALADAV
ncbi:hypothetical protein [Oscillibacter sp.]|uniref:hypothetical protein n=1 Tax=Oscillibacter sp. TaxID=1945593 RepID=UPI00289CC0AA|nr:hypothetical protein [Oscillibacter sp.]